jgi:hypothetical protein
MCVCVYVCMSLCAAIVHTAGEADRQSHTHTHTHYRCRPRRYQQCLRAISRKSEIGARAGNVTIRSGRGRSWQRYLRNFPSAKACSSSWTARGLKLRGSILKGKGKGMGFRVKLELLYGCCPARPAITPRCTAHPACTLAPPPPPSCGLRSLIKATRPPYIRSVP